MIRIGAILVGLGFTLVVLISFVTGFITWSTEEVEKGPEYSFHEHPQNIAFAHEGPFGHWDTQQLQRGYQVYKEVCAACHSLKYVAFRDLGELGYSEAEVAALAAEWQVPGINPDTGESVLRPGEPTDYFPDVYPNAVAAAAANNNAIPPDLSLMTKARHNGSDYVASLLSGYEPVPEELKAQFPNFNTPEGLYYNSYFPYLNIAMAPPLTQTGQVTYADGTEATVGQMATDVAAFLTWTAEPTLIERKQTGWATLAFLLVATILAYLAKRQIWSAVKPKKAKA
ncbi:cytochrome c1 [Qipengyuania sp. JC766]|uniref:cytochrome c1 n=1 Tax=Qipengyuania sp. JC766 TaxID=3232139 RepID=UPI003459F0E3